MAATRYPNESQEYRAARDALLEQEYALIRQVKDVARQRRALPPGGKIAEDYVFEGANDDNLGQQIALPELFGQRQTLLLYSYMFGPEWDRPCLSCTSLIDGFDPAAPSAEHDAAFAIVAAAPAARLNSWA